MKKPVILLAALLFSCSAFAVNGPYVGIGFGYSNTIFDIDQYATATIGHLTGNSWKKHHGTSSGFQGQLVTGYAYDINKFRLGAEITAQMPKTSCSDNSSSDHAYHYEFNYAYAINLMSGYYVTDHDLLYLKIGATRGKFMYREITHTGYTIMNSSFHATGLNLGLGTELYLSKHFRLRLEYLYTQYPTQRFITNLTLPEDIAVTINNKIKPRVHTIMLGIDYHFDYS